MKNAQYIEIYGGDDDAVMCTLPGVTGVVMPVGLVAPAADFHDTGWLSEDGISWDDTYDKVTITAHQGGVEVIEVISKAGREFKFQCLEETALTMGLRYPGYVPTEVAGTPAGKPKVYGGEVPVPTSDVRSWIIGTYSISNPGHRTRKVVPKGQVSGVGSLVAKRGEVSIYEFTVKVLEGRFFIYGNSPGMAPAAP